MSSDLYKAYLLHKQAAGANVFKRIGRSVVKAFRRAPPGAKKVPGRGVKEILKDHPVLTILGAGAILGSAGYAEDALRAGHRAATKQKDFNKALNFDPEVKRWYNSDPKGVEARFSTLHRFNPDAARDPLVASSWIKQTMEFPAVTPRMVIEATPGDKKRLQMQESLILKTLGGSRIREKTLPILAKELGISGGD